MAPAQSSRGATTRLSILLLGGILATGIYYWYKPCNGLPSRLISARHTEDSGLRPGSHSSSDLSLVGKRGTTSGTDEYSCGPDKPCSNGACCGASGNCGYGATYCGTGCVSHCDATAECGKDAKVPGTTCPLNTCCSQYGFVSLYNKHVLSRASIYLTFRSAAPRQSSVQVRFVPGGAICSAKLTTKCNRQLSEQLYTYSKPSQWRFPNTSPAKQGDRIL